jgi:hypothetical protein
MRATRPSSEARPSLLEVLENRLLLSAAPQWLVHWQGDFGTAGTTFKPSENSGNGTAATGDYDADGASDDQRLSLTFSDATPLNPSFFGGVYNGSSATFYGGVYATAFNAPAALAPGQMGSVVDNSNGDRLQAAWTSPSGETSSSFDTLFYWKQADFLSGDAPATLSALSTFKLNITRWDAGVGSGRWVVRSGGQFYVSQDTFSGTGVKWLKGSTLVNEKWALYNPSAGNIEFNQSAAVFNVATSSLTSIDAVGFMSDADGTAAGTNHTLNFDDVEIALSGGMDGLDVSTATYFGGSGTDAAGGVAVAPDGTIFYGGTLVGVNPGGVTPTNLLGGGNGVVIHLNAAGTQVISVTRVGTAVTDIEIAPDGKIAVAAAGVGPVVLAPDGLSVVWSASVSGIDRISIGNNDTVAALDTVADLNHNVYVYNASGSQLGLGHFADNRVADVLVDSDRSQVLVTGDNSKYTSLEPIRVNFIRAYSYDFQTLNWRDYDWSGSNWRGGPQGADVADNIGVRISLGRDGKLYYAAESDGGNSTFLYDPHVPGTLLTSSQLISGDVYSQGWGVSGAKHFTWFGRYNPATGDIEKAQWLMARDPGNNQGNTCVPTSITADEQGRVYIGGSSYWLIKDHDSKAIGGVPVGAYCSGEAFVAVVSPDFLTRQTWTPFTLAGSEQYGSGVGVDVRNGRAALAVDMKSSIGSLITTSNAVQSARGAGYEGYLAVWDQTTTAVPNAPTGLKLSTTPTSLDVNLTWTDNSTAETAYYVDRSVDGGATWTQIAALSSNVTGYWDKAVDSSTTYAYRVRAQNASGMSGASNTLTVSTPAAVTLGGFTGIVNQDKNYSVIGSTSFDLNTYTYTVNQTGSQILDSGRLFYGKYYVGFVQRLHGDGELVVHIAGYTGGPSWNTQVGILMQDVLGGGNVVSLDGGGAGYGSMYIGGTTVGNSFASSTRWMKLVRIGNTFTGYVSSDGAAWTQVGTTTLVMAGSDIFAGFGQKVHPADSQLTTTFDNVALNHIGGGDYSAQTAERVYVRRNPTNTANLEIFANLPGAPDTHPTYRVKASAISSLFVDTKGGNDTLVVDDPYAPMNCVLPSGGISFDGGTGADTLQVIGASSTDAFTLTGTQVVHGSGVVAYANAEALTLQNGAFTAGGDIGAKTINVGTSVASANVTFGATQHLSGLNIGANSTATLAAGGSKVLVTNTLTIAGTTGAWTGTLDVKDNGLAVNYTGAAPLDTIRNQLLSGLTGKGITSGGIAPNKSLATADNAVTNYPSLLGETVNAQSILVRSAVKGDANWDSAVDVVDLGLLATNYGQSSGASWAGGDFSLDGAVDVTDLGLLATYYGTVAGSASAAVDAPVESTPVALAAETSSPAPTPSMSAEMDFPADSAISTLSASAPAIDVSPAAASAPDETVDALALSSRVIISTATDSAEDSSGLLDLDVLEVL